MVKLNLLASVNYGREKVKSKIINLPTTNSVTSQMMVPLRYLQGMSSRISPGSQPFSIAYAENKKIKVGSYNIFKDLNKMLA